MKNCFKYLVICVALLGLFISPVFAQYGVNDTIRLGGIEYKGANLPCIFLPECTIVSQMLNEADRKRIAQLRNNVYAVYSYAITAGEVFKQVNAELEKKDDRRSRKQYLKSVDKRLDVCFKQPLKSLSIDQGHVLIKLINRQTGTDCYHVIKELKGGLSAFVWQSVGVFFNNNLKHEYDPKGEDRELEMVVAELESSAAYSYQLFLQDEMMKKTRMK